MLADSYSDTSLLTNTTTHKAGYIKEFLMPVKTSCYLWVEFFRAKCRSGETGRRTGLKIPRGQPHVGSIPTSGTKYKMKIKRKRAEGKKQEGKKLCNPQMIMS